MRRREKWKEKERERGCVRKGKITSLTHGGEKMDEQTDR